MQMFSKPKMPPLPKIIPMADENAIQAAKNKSIALQQATGGRQSTILTQGNTLGGS